MSYREKYRQMFALDEGLRLRAYRDTEGHWTIGIGRNLDAMGVGPVALLRFRTLGITREKAMEWLEEDVRQAEQDCRVIFGTSLFLSWSENRRLGWVNFLFNLGFDRASKFHNTLINARGGQWSWVEKGLKDSKWYHQLGPEYPGEPNRADRVIAMIVCEEWPYA
jgi:lysozyme